jgi:anhydro-N-acetylmuramic acid kinase
MLFFFEICFMSTEKKLPKYYVLGIMSGSSLDGLDLALCRFVLQKEQPDRQLIHEWELIKGSTLAFTAEWKQRLRNLPSANALEIMQADADFGHYTGQQANQFLKNIGIAPDLIAFHGHTIFHNPTKQLTVQIGDGAAVAAETSLPVINQFRHQDVACGGEGAPIASIADRYLLSDFDFCLNLGGISNVTALLAGRTIAFDIGPANQILNALAGQRQLEYDDGGRIAASGRVHPPLLEALNQADYYQREYPKTLDNFWGGRHILSKIQASGLSLEDQMRTAVDHIVFQVAKSLERLIIKEKLQKKQYQLLPSGGGVFNTFMMKQLKKQLAARHVIIQEPEPSFAAFKEAILMALMGVLRIENIPNVMCSVTGAGRDTIGGAIHQGYSKII